MPPRPSTNQQRNLLNVSRALVGFFVVASMGIVTGFVKTTSYSNEVEFAKETREQRKNFKPHRCNDRLEDFIQVLLGEDAHTWRDARPAARCLWQCLSSKPGLEPSDPYFMLMAGDSHYISPGERAAQRAAAASAAEGSHHTAQP
eukprot:CAMPEP_0202899292 /NCGR_PEP_ID=MMETSP1392-20130828/7566_1 /ASSEMBLY_ACC=CAM_ASM_000868 /TAXON_ID=225041 /ORGANISM="Chlamydomonas chlamydogama, Strain SAG 11-48b" /LENGTH=144 /DNA_ID=CAMNT_0049585433 /DNA_START=54 /DNA_END=488 /DNA_ORIENTATION=-